MNNSLHEEQYANAKRKLKKIKSFYTHLSVYLVINLYFLIKNYLLNSWDRVVDSLLTISLFWGIGLFFHWYRVFGKDFIFSKEWEARKIQELMNKNKDE